MLQAVVHWVHRGLAWLILAGLVVEFYLAGASVFKVTSFAPHVDLGRTIGTAILLLLVIGLLDRSERRIVGLSAILVALMIVQWVLPGLWSVMPAVAAFHVIVGMALIGVTFRIASALGTGMPVRRPLNARIIDADRAQSSPVTPAVHAS